MSQKEVDRALFLNQVKKALVQPRPSLEASRNYIRENSWEVRFSKHIDELLQDYSESTGLTPVSSPK
jgi:hypothetical protein